MLLLPSIASETVSVPAVAPVLLAASGQRRSQESGRRRRHSGLTYVSVSATISFRTVGQHRPLSSIKAGPSFSSASIAELEVALCTRRACDVRFSAGLLGGLCCCGGWGCDTSLARAAAASLAAAAIAAAFEAISDIIWRTMFLSMEVAATDISTLLLGGRSPRRVGGRSVRAHALGGRLPTAWPVSGRHAARSSEGFSGTSPADEQGECGSAT